MKKSEKSEKILDVALTLLKNEGDYGVTMRQVAAGANMTLSNVQYYFKNKDNLLVALADRYFQSCLSEMREMPKLTSEATLHEDLTSLVKAFLCHGLELSEMCRIFREYWAISTRNAAIEQYLKAYYQSSAQVLNAIFSPVAATPDNASKAVSLFIPFVEGYSITAMSLTTDFESDVKDMCDLLHMILLRP